MEYWEQTLTFKAFISIEASSDLIFKAMSDQKNNIPLQIVRHFWSNIVRGVGTKYFIVLTFAAVWMLMFDRYNVPAQLNMSKQIQQEKRNEQWYLQANEGLDAQRVRLETNEEELERIAREQFLMSKKGEVVYLIDEGAAAQP
ncbi:MAG: septum formation initiator family protein [Bacteroidia bacterium]|nr:septum formation initiator family protein [Bacteroidia bacterium]